MRPRLALLSDLVADLRVAARARVGRRAPRQAEEKRSADEAKRRLDETRERLKRETPPTRD